MKFTFSTLACPDWEWEKVVNEAKKLGYDGIELRCLKKELDFRRMKPFFPENIAVTKKLLQDKKLEISCLDTSCTFHNTKDYEKNLIEGKEAIDLAKKLNCKYIRIFGEHIPDNENEEGIIRQIAAGADELGAYAVGRGVIVLIESHGSFSRGSTMQRLMQYITSKEVGVLWDVANGYYGYGESPEDTFSFLKGYIRYVHIKDLKGKYPDTNLCMIGKGDLPLNRVITLLRSSNYNGWLSLEWEKLWVPDLEEPEVALDVYLNYMRSLLERY